MDRKELLILSFDIGKVVHALLMNTNVWLQHHDMMQKELQDFFEDYQFASEINLLVLDLQLVIIYELFTLNKVQWKKFWKTASSFKKLVSVLINICWANLPFNYVEEICVAYCSVSVLFFP